MIKIQFKAVYSKGLQSLLFKNKRKAQAALEFLMTYGWGILVVLAAIGALAYFGVFSSQKFVPESCVISSTTGAACLDFKVTQDSAYLLFHNGGGRAIHLYNVSFDSCRSENAVTIQDGTNLLINVTGCSFGVIGTRFKQDFTVVYSLDDSDIIKSAKGTINAQVTE